MDLILNSSIIDMDFIDKLNVLIMNNVNKLNLLKKYSITIHYTLRNTVFADVDNINLKSSLLKKHTSKLKEFAQMNKINIQSVFFDEKDDIDTVRISLEPESIEIKDIKQYHVGIHKKYEKLFVELTLDNANILTDNIILYLISFLTENKIPFEPDRTYEIFVFYNYFNQDKISNTEAKIQIIAENIRKSLIDFIPFVDVIFIFGEETQKQYETKIQIHETSERRPCRNFILIDDSIREKIIQYYKNILITYYLENFKPVKKNGKHDKAIVSLKEDLAKPLDLSEDEIVNYRWAVEPINSDKVMFDIADRKKNSVICLMIFEDKSFAWTVYCKPKIFDKELKERQNEVMEIYLNKLLNRTSGLFKEIYNMLIYPKYMAFIVDLPEDSDVKDVWEKFAKEYLDLTNKKKEILLDKVTQAIEKKEKDKAEEKEYSEQLSKMADDVGNDKLKKAEFDESKKIIKEEDVKFYFHNAKKITFEDGEVIYRYYCEYSNGWRYMKYV